MNTTNNTINNSAPNVSQIPESNMATSVPVNTASSSASTTTVAAASNNAVGRSSDLNSLPSLRNLSDKLYEKRKAAALDIEKLVRDIWSSSVQNDQNSLVNSNEVRAAIEARILAMIDHLTYEFAYSVFPNARNGGLIGLAAMSIALGQDVSIFLSHIAPPVLACFGDQDSRVRYYACEAMYNIAKVSREGMLVYFNEVFDCLCGLTSDTEVSVKNGAELLDRLLKDVVAENSKFDVSSFIPLLQERIKVIHPHARQFLVSWIGLLWSVPTVNLIPFVNYFLDGLLVFLSDSNQDIRTQTHQLLQDVLVEVKSHAEEVDRNGLVKILCRHLTSDDPVTQSEALIWMNSMFSLFRHSVLPLLKETIHPVISALSHTNPQIKSEAMALNEQLFKFVQGSDADLMVQPLVKELVEQFLKEKEASQVASLDWLLMLHKKDPSKVFTPNDDSFAPLLRTLSDASDQVIKRDLRLLAQISCAFDDAYFRQFLCQLLLLFQQDRKLLDTRGGLIIRQLCLSLSAERVFHTLADLVVKDEDSMEFNSVFAQHLMIILLTASELIDLRRRLKNLESKENQLLFCSLYKCFSNNAVSTLSLCLLAQVYEHAYHLIIAFGDVEITVSLLVQIDKLVQLLESPIFTHLRLQLLEPERWPFLYRALYALLMLLPQSSAFATLRNRLNSVSAVSYLPSIQKKKKEPATHSNSKTELPKETISFAELMNYWKQLQQKHEKYRRLHEKK